MNLKPLNSVSLTEAIKAEAQNLGFFAFGIAKAEAVDDKTAKHIKNWIQKHFMRKHQSLRRCRLF